MTWMYWNAYYDTFSGEVWYGTPTCVRCVWNPSFIFMPYDMAY